MNYNAVIRPDAAGARDPLGVNGENWIKGAWERQGGLCLHGAIRACQPRPGDAVFGDFETMVTE